MAVEIGGAADPVGARLDLVCRAFPAASVNAVRIGRRADEVAVAHLAIPPLANAAIAIVLIDVAAIGKVVAGAAGLGATRASGTGAFCRAAAFDIVQADASEREATHAVDTGIVATVLILTACALVADAAEAVEATAAATVGREITRLAGGTATNPVRAREIAATGCRSITSILRCYAAFPIDTNAVTATIADVFAVIAAREATPTILAGDERAAVTCSLTSGAHESAAPLV